MRRHRIALLAAPLLLALAGGTRADEPLRLAGTQLPADGVLSRRAADVVGAEHPTHTRILEIEAPPVEGRRYRIVGTVAYQDVPEGGYLEMWSELPDGSRYFTRTLDAEGPLARLQGSSPPRPFALPFDLGADGPPPRRVELAVALMGPGRVTLTDLRFEAEPASAAAGFWWSEREAGIVGGVLGTALGLLGAAIGTLASLGRARRFALGALQGMAAFGAAALATGAVAFALGQPYAVWYPLALAGAIAGALGLGLRRTVRSRYDAVEPLRHPA